MSIITTAIGLILVYLILSLIASSLQEVLASWLKLRSKHLGHALEQMLTNEKTEEGTLELDKDFLEKFKGNHLFRDLIPDKHRKKAGSTAYPSYMSAGVFANIILEVLDGKDLDQLKEIVGKMPDGSLKTYLNHGLEDTEEDLAGFRARMESWYDSVMSRVTGWYKRYSHNLILALGFVIAAYMNADTLSIYQKMSQVAQGSQQEQEIMSLAQGFIDNGFADFSGQIDNIKQTVDSATTAQLDSTQFVENLLASNQQLLSQVDSLANEVTGVNSPLGLGWTQEELDQIKAFQPMVILNKIFGLIITALAISLGAPFWFDILKRLMNIRNAGPIQTSSTNTGNGNNNGQNTRQQGSYT